MNIHWLRWHKGHRGGRGRHRGHKRGRGGPRGLGGYLRRVLRGQRAAGDTPHGPRPPELNDALFLSVLITAAVLLFGSVEAWALALVGGAIVVYFNFRLYRMQAAPFQSGGGRIVPAGMRLSMAGFAALVLIQLIPIPLSAIREVFSRPEYGFLKELSLSTPGGAAPWHSLSIDADETIRAAVRFLLYVMVFFVAFLAGGNRRALKRAFSILAFFGLAMTVFAIIQKAAWNGRIYWFRALRNGGSPFGPFVNRDHFAGFEGMVFPLGLALALETRRVEKALLYVFVSAVTAVGIFYSLSRGGIVSFMVSGLVFLLLVRIKKSGGKPVYFLALFAAAFAVYIACLGISPVIGRFETGGVSSSQRLLIWRGALGAARDFKWSGTGLGTFREIFPLYNPGLQPRVDFAHNDYINLAVETGLPGLLLALIFFASLGKAVYNCFREGRVPYLLCGLLASVSYMLVHSMFDFNLHIPANAITFSAVTGFLAAGIQDGGFHEGGKEIDGGGLNRHPLPHPAGARRRLPGHGADNRDAQDRTPGRHRGHSRKPSCHERPLR
ncbi:MAG: O-antigen ligase family protein [Nitrospiraceae bacterium]|nr:O-antigen ligase family protein [Nitrospiraceae bacterium]